LGLSPERVLVNAPKSVPLKVFVERLTVGDEAVPQQTPLALKVVPPLEVMLPPLTAALFVTDVASAVLPTTGRVVGVLKGITDP
jgi:hypothetical protein